MDINKLEQRFRNICQGANSAEVRSDQGLGIFVVRDWYREIDNIYISQVSLLHLTRYKNSLHFPWGAESVPAPVVKACAALVDDPPLTERGGKMMMDVSTGGASIGVFACVVGEEPSPPPSSTSDAIGAESTSSPLSSSSVDNNGGKGIGLSITRMHLATRDT